MKRDDELMLDALGNAHELLTNAVAYINAFDTLYLEGGLDVKKTRDNNRLLKARANYIRTLTNIVEKK